MSKIILGRSQDNITLDCAFEEFSMYNKAKNLSPRTIEYYEENYLLFKEFTELTYCNEVNERKITAYVVYLFDQRKLKDVTISSKLRNLAPFINFCIKRKYIDSSVEVPHVKEEETIKELYTQQEIELLIKKPAMRTCSFSEYRNWVIINYVLATRQ